MYRGHISATAHDLLIARIARSSLLSHSSLVLAYRTNGRATGTVLRPSSVVVFVT